MLIVLLASLVVFNAPATGPSLERFTVEICDAPDAQDVQMRSRQQSDDDRTRSSHCPHGTAMLGPPLARRDLVSFGETPAFGFLDPPSLKSGTHTDPTARGPPAA